MKNALLLFPLLFVQIVQAQNSLSDSIKLGPYTSDSVEVLISTWINFMSYEDHPSRLYNYAVNDKKAKFIFSNSYPYEDEPGMYYKEMQVCYDKLTAGGNRDSSDRTNGSVHFDLVFGARGEYLVFEFRKLIFTSVRNEMANYEDAQLLSSDGIHHLKEEDSHWARIKGEYYDRLGILATNLKSFLLTHYKTPHRAIRLKERW